MTTARSILHVDMDAFYVSVELLRRPELVGRPVVVGASSTRGVVAAASYEARRYGVHSAMASSRARQLCPDAVFLPPDMEHYLDVSARLHEIFCEFTPLVEQISVDEAFLDVSGARSLMGSPNQIARSLRREVHERESLWCSVGVAPNKFLAKLASEHAKPHATPSGVHEGHGVWEVHQGGELDFIRPMSVGALWGVGPATRRRLEDVGVRTVADLAALELDVVKRVVGDAVGAHLHALAHGVDDRPVLPDRVAKSIGHEETFARDLLTRHDVHVELVRLCEAVARRTRAAGVAAGTMLLKVRFGSFDTVTRSVTPSMPISSAPAMVAAVEPLMEQIDPSVGIRLLGVHAQKLSVPVEPQPTLFDDGGFDDAMLAGADLVDAIEREWRGASTVVDSINERFGPGVIGPASVLRNRPRPGERPFGPEGE